MAIVNKFNVNKQQVTLDADIIENMSANDVSYDDSFQYDENTVGDKLSEFGQQVIYDVTANNNGATFASLSELLSSENLSTLIPTSVRHGGMSIRFVQSSDNKYVQYRLMHPSWNTVVANWQGVDDEPTAGSKNLVDGSGVAKYTSAVVLKSNNFRNGSTGNQANLNTITTECMYIGGIRKFAFYTNRNNRTGCKYCFGYALTSSTDDIGNKLQQNKWSGYITHKDVVYSNDGNYIVLGDNYTTAKGMAVTIAEYNIETHVIQQLRTTDFDGYDIYIIPCEVFATKDDLDNTNDRIDTIDEEYEELNVKVNSNTYNLSGLSYNLLNCINGSQGNPGNDWVVTFGGNDTKAIPVTPKHKYRLKIGIESEEGYTFFLRILYYNTNNPSGLNGKEYIVRDEFNNPAYWHTLNDVINIQDGEYGISIQILEQITKSTVQSSPNTIALRAIDFENSENFIIDITNSLTEEVQKLDTEITNLNVRVTNLEGSLSDDVIKRNADKIPMLINSCRYHKSSSSYKNFQVAICTDMHADRLPNKNVIAATNGFPYIDAYVNCGDIVASNYNELTTIQNFNSDISLLTKPGYVVVGNHDVGNAYYVGVCCNHNQAYESFIKVMVDNGWLESGEYEDGKPYWYHDIENYKIRIIGLYEYDDNLDLMTNSYWEPVTYDDTKSVLTYNTSYNIGDIVNAGTYKEYSFRCTQEVTTPENWYTDTEKIPCYRVRRGYRVIRQTQAQWFLDTLASTPSDYGVVIITHNPFSDTSKSIDAKFSWPSGVIGGNSSWTQSYMATNFIRNAIVAFNNGADYSEKVVMNGEASYLNVLNDGAIYYAYEVAKNFSNNNSNVSVLGLLGGHGHRDLIWKDATENIYQISPSCARVDGANDMGCDIRRTNTDELSRDSVTCVSFASGRIGLVKLGVNVTERGTFRDYEVINTTT